MPTDALLSLALQNGVGVLIAVIVIYWKRQDDKEAFERERARTADEQAEKRAIAEILKAHTEALVALRESLKSVADVTMIERQLSDMRQQIDRRERQP